MSFADLALARYSCRSYKDRAIEPEKLATIIEAGRVAPSAHNNHPTRIVVCDTPELCEKAARAATAFAKDGSVFGAPAIILACAKPDEAWVRRGDNMNSALIDSAIVVDHMMMQATELGLGTCWVCMFKADVARAEFNLPEDMVPVSMLTLGYPADCIADADAREARRIPLETFCDLKA